MIKSSIVVISIIICSSAFTLATTVEIASRVNLGTKRNIYLSDIVKNKINDAYILKQLNLVKLSNAPQKGERRIFTSRAISQTIRQNSKLKKLKFKIPKHVIVENKIFEINASEISKKLKAQWQKLCNECEFKISDIRLPQIPANLTANKWQLVEDGNIPINQFSKLIKIYQGKDIKNLWISGQVKIFKNVPVLKRTLFIGQSVQPNDIAFEKREITYLRDKVTPTKAQIFGKKLKTGIRSNKILWLDNLQREKAAERGDVITVSTSSDTWSLSLRAIAQQSGFVGDVIKLLNPYTKKIITAKIIGQNKAELL